MVVFFKGKIFEPLDARPREAANAEQVHGEDGEEEADAHDAERPLPLFHKDAMKHKRVSPKNSQRDRKVAKLAV